MEKAKLVGKTLKIDPSMVKELSAGVYGTWSMIQYDADVRSNADAMELTLDAGRMRERYPEADDIVNALCEEFGYKPVHRALCREFKLV